jgi:heme a synthase
MPITTTDLRHSRGAVRVWLILLIALVFTMIVVGGITRLTGSGLSIVEWAPIMGAIPPLSEAAWQKAFEQYQQFPQYRIDNAHMSLQDFKGIFFWEYMHRLLARSIGVVFLLPFLWFWSRGCFTRPLALRLLVAFGLGGLQGLVGWLMVASGLVDEPHVSHFRLATHLGLAFLIMAYFWWILLSIDHGRRAHAGSGSVRRWLWGIGILAVIQMIYGAFVAGLRAGKIYNTFPKMGDNWIAPEVMRLQPVWINLLQEHATVQFVHRWLGTLLLLLVVVFWTRGRDSIRAPAQRYSRYGLVVLTAAQYFLGVYTLLGGVPLVPAVMHQGCAALLLLSIVQVFFHHQAPRVA